MMARKNTIDRSARLQWFPLYCDDYLGSALVARLSMVGECIYLRLLIRQWQARGAGLPDDQKALRRLAGWQGGKGWPEVWETLSEAFPVDADGMRRNARLHGEWLRALVEAGTNHARASAGGQATAAKHQQTGPTQAKQSRPTEALQSPRSGVLLDAQVVENQQPASASSALGVQTVTIVSTTDVVDTATTASSALSPAVERVLALLPEAMQRDAVRAFLQSRSVARQLSFVSTLEGMATGISAAKGRPVSWYQIGRGTVDAIGTVGEQVTANALRAFIEKAPAAPAQDTADAAEDLQADAAEVVRDHDGRVVWAPGMPDHLRPPAEA